jgi:hypothetical protein
MADNEGNGHNKPIPIGQTVTLPRPTKPTGGSHEGDLGVVRLMDSAGIPREFITVGKDFDEALGRTTILDDNQLNDIIAYKAQLVEQELWEELADLVSWLNGRPAIGGYNRLYSLMAHIGILSPEALGVRLSKEGAESLRKAQDARDHQQKKQDAEQHPG